MARNPDGPTPGSARAKKGGDYILRTYGKKHLARIGAKGGRKTYKRYGREHMVKIGIKGQQSGSE